MTDMNGQKRCGGCGTQRDKGQTCPICGLVNDPIPMTYGASGTHRRSGTSRSWTVRRRDGPRYAPESYAAELDRDLEMLFPRRGVE